MNPRSTPSVAPWITGTLVAFAGVLVTRLVAPHLADPARAGLAAAGQFSGLAGLFIIAVGVRRRLHASAPEQDPAP